MLRLALVVLCAGAVSLAEVDNNSGPYNGVQTAYGPPQVQNSYGPPQVQSSYGPPQVQSSYGPPAGGYEPAGYGADASVLDGDLFSGPLSAALGYKLGAVGFVVKALGWLALHAWAVLLGAVATFAFCKVTAICDLTYHKQLAEHLHEQVRSFATPERLATASKMLEDAMDKFAPSKSKKN